MASVFKNIGRAVKKGVKDVGHQAGRTLSNPLVQAGLGALTGGAAVPLLAGVAGGALRPGGNLKRAAVGGLQGGAAGLGGKAVRTGVTALRDYMGRRGDAPGPSGPYPDNQPIGYQGAGGGGFDWGSLLKGGASSIANFVKAHPDLLLGGAGAVNAALLSRKAGQLSNAAQGAAQGSWDSRAPLRTGGVTAMQNVLSANPWARKSVAQNVSPLTGSF